MSADSYTSRIASLSAEECDGARQALKERLAAQAADEDLEYKPVSLFSYLQTMAVFSRSLRVEVVYDGDLGAMSMWDFVRFKSMARNERGEMVLGDMTGL